MTRTIVTRFFALAATAALAVLAAEPGLPAQAQGVLQGAWRTDGGWLTELRTHPDGARVCSTGKAGTTPHGFGFTVVKSGDETVVMVVDQTQPPAPGTDALAFVQGGRTVGTIPAQVTGPAVGSRDANGAEAPRLLAGLAPGPVTIAAGDRRWELDLAGLPAARAALDRCLERAK
ncbi:hypothetical protein PQJ75_30070 [Rhodoplanes sp. TEM]|uniref:Uncharacterized protein n=1 Tax=Rhodoplanes tepidamans TaxID=200616 RepID=A0ABT5JFI9_RHOTP|nr:MULTISPECIES: hypothetical protein [Rhodoplanes]MDC7788469.1 hypothetical protein [Rhodoplanes tepidamans]MDC7988001.1 hypothetical protein [Rhodoplanes sp. TEM]MDQ0358607.1 hypothetical protein [Rhodoplanes tepidamans]